MPSRMIRSVMSRHLQGPVPGAVVPARRAPAAQHRVGDPCGPHVLADVVDADDVGARRRRRAPWSRRSPRPAGRAAGRAAGPRVDLREVPRRIGRPSARSAPRSASSARLWSGVFPNPNPGSTISPSHGDAGGEGALERRPEVGDHLRHDVAIARLGAVVHQHDRHAAGRREPDHRRVVGHAPDVVDEMGAGIEGGLGDGRHRRVDRDRAWPAARPRTARTTGTTRASSASTGTGAWPGRLEAPPTSSRSAPSATIRRAWSTAAPTGSARGEQPVAGEGVGRGVEHAHHERAGAPGERRGSDDRRRRGAGRAAVARCAFHATHAATGSRSAGIVDQPRPRERRRGTGSRRPRPARRRCAAPVEGRRRVGLDEHGRAWAGPPARPRRGRRPAARAARRGRCTRWSRRRRRAGRDRGDDRRHVLVGHGRPDEHRRTRRSGVAAREVRAEVVERPREGRGAVRVVGAVEEHLAPPPAGCVGLDQLEPAGPACRRVPLPPRGVRDAGDARPPRARPAARPRPRRWRPGGARGARPRSGPSRGSATRCRSRVQSRTGGGSTTVSGTRRRAARRRITARASPVAPVTATSPRSMIAAFSRAIAVTVGPRRSVWSRPTLVTTATPPSQAWVASSRPPSPTSTSATSSDDSAKCRNITAVSSSNSVGGPSRGAIRSATGSTLPTRRANVAASIGRPSTTIRSR